MNVFYSKITFPLTSLICSISFISYTLYLKSYEKIQQDGFVKILQEWLEKNEATLVSVSAIFIGIYIATYSILLTISSHSVFAKLSYDNFNKFLDFIKEGLLSASLFITLSLINVFPKANFFSSICKTTIMIFTTIFMLLSAIRVIYFIYKTIDFEIKKNYESLQDIEDRNKEMQVIIQRLHKFLNEEQAKTHAEKSKKMK